MGVSTDAILFYGYCWDEEWAGLLPSDEEGGDEAKWPKVILRRRGVANPWDSYPSEESRAADRRAELDAWYAAKAAVKEEYGCDIGRHCSGDCPMPFVSVGKVYEARRGYPEEVASLEVGADWGERLERFMADLGIARPDGQDAPRWWLVSYWG